ncbi:RNase P/RNase MRP complex subunit [Geranomyces michiganensis]|nr:RNase P/RNase MRP complex subunit [Geranomyces michiganensis]
MPPKRKATGRPAKATPDKKQKAAAKQQSATIELAPGSSGTQPTPSTIAPAIPSQWSNPDATGPLYDPLPAVLTTDTAVANPSLTASIPTPFTRPFVQNLLTITGSQSTSTAERNYTQKVHQKVLSVVNPPTTPAMHFEQKDKRAVQQRNRKAKPLSAAERRKLGAWEVDKKVCTYEGFKPLHALWESYMAELLAGMSLATASVLPRLIKADYHGAKLAVSKAKCPTLIGLAGIIIKETENTFVIVTPSNAVKNIPKRNTVFTFETQGRLFTLYGSQIRVRAGERAAKKFKDKPTVDIK